MNTLSAGLTMPDWQMHLVWDVFVAASLVGSFCCSKDLMDALANSRMEKIQLVNAVLQVTHEVEVSPSVNERKMKLREYFRQ